VSSRKNVMKFSACFPLHQASLVVPVLYFYNNKLNALSKKSFISANCSGFNFSYAIQQKPSTCLNMFSHLFSDCITRTNNPVCANKCELAASGHFHCPEPTRTLIFCQPSSVQPICKESSKL
jgi:hypothetical protein